MEAAAVAVIWVVVGGGVGALIGSSKGRGGLGFVLGLLLGILGWIIVAALRDSPGQSTDVATRPAYANTAPAQWAADPFGRHEYRLFDGAEWTNRVSDRGVESTDEPTAQPQHAAGGTWAPDPFGRFDQRYHDAGGWTSHVATAGVTYSDPPGFPDQAGGQRSH